MKHSVELGEIWGDNVKILNSLTGTVLITSDIENFDKNQYQLVERE